MKKFFLVALIFVAMFISACTASSNSNVEATLAPVPAEFAGQSNPLGDDAATAGADVFKTNCVPCHGEKGYGDGPAGAALDPAPKNLAELQTTASDDYLYWRINTGKSGTSMVAWKGILSDEQIWQVIAFIRTLK